ncbi:MAG: hypothetical protein J6P47_05630, partial [Acetobacter sp.]|nr:hypothetical protein [Acetobacter sp.]
MSLWRFRYLSRRFLLHQQMSNDTCTLLWRLWHGWVRQYYGRISFVIVLTILTALLTALYPLVIQQALDMFTARDLRVLYQVPLLVIAIT